MEFKCSHFEKFRSCYPEPPLFSLNDKAEGKMPEKLLGKVSLVFPDAANRAQLIGRQPCKNIDTSELCVSILAWGGIRPDHFNLLFTQNKTNVWLPVAEQIRQGNLTRKDAFDRFTKLRENDNLPGMGPAYFTKLIYFLMPRKKDNPIGYIMDQWLGCSINLLFNELVVKLNHSISWSKNVTDVDASDISSTVSDFNTGDNYERFCLAVEKVSSEIGDSWTPESAELAMMSAGRKKPQVWRKYVVEQRLRALSQNKF